jgi:hypothetical protein
MVSKTHLEVLAEQAKRTMERRARQQCDCQVRIGTRMMKIIMLLRPPVHHGTQSLHLEQGLLAFQGHMNLQPEERKYGEMQFQGIEE